MSSQVKMLELITFKDGSLDKLIQRVPDTASAEYVKEAKVIKRIFKQGMKAIRRAAKKENEPTEHQTALAELELKDQEYSAVYKFDDAKTAKASLRDLADDWLTPAYGQHGGNTWRTHHGGPRGCFLITVDKVSKQAILWAADSNKTDLPDDMEGAEDVDEEDGDNSGDRDDLEAELGILISGAGVSVSNIKDMDAAERSTHAAKCAGDRSIGAKALASLAEKMGCDDGQNTKLKRLEWVFNTYI
jgi:hypothetical protein